MDVIPVGKYNWGDPDWDGKMLLGNTVRQEWLIGNAGELDVWRDGFDGRQTREKEQEKVGYHYSRKNSSYNKIFHHWNVLFEESYSLTYTFFEQWIIVLYFFSF